MSAIAPPEFVLASASTARRQLLQQAGIEPLICKSDFDEDQVQLDDPQALVTTLAQAKAAAVATRYPEALILGCDSVLAIQGEIHGKPASPTEAIARWQKMRGQVGHLYTGHALLEPRRQRQIVRCGVTAVHFVFASDRLIADYVASGEPMNCAGCFAIDGKGGLLVEKLVGCPSNVIGLSLPLLHAMLNELGYSVADFWARQG